jgi:hypothetical protein
LATYRIYHVGSGGRLRLGETFQASGDDEAVARARPLLTRGQPAELWEAGRIVGRFSDTHAFARGDR